MLQGGIPSRVGEQSDTKTQAVMREVQGLTSRAREINERVSRLRERLLGVYPIPNEKDVLKDCPTANGAFEDIFIEIKRARDTLDRIAVTVSDLENV